jgi:S-adenosylmethionine/arginine decarboxylase-like enzyme
MFITEDLVEADGTLFHTWPEEHQPSGTANFSRIDVPLLMCGEMRVMFFVSSHLFHQF